ncbi:MAG: hypothetical protein R2822_00385 [Spirosomataceae bacterium]
MCVGDTLKLSTIPLPNATYLWKNPAGIVISSSHVLILENMQPIMNGKYSIEVIQTTCSKIDTVNVQVKPKPVFVLDSVICAPSLKTYTVYGKSNGGVAAVQGTVVQSDSLFSVSGIMIDTKAILTFSKNSCDTTLEINAPNCQCPGLPISVSPALQTICEGDTLQTLSALVSSGVTADWYDAPSGGTLLAAGILTFKPSSAGKIYVAARQEVSNCVSNIRAVAEVVIHPVPTFNATTISTSCDGLNARKDGKLQVLELIDGKRYDFSVGNTYTGNKTYTTAVPIPSNGILVDTLSNPLISTAYTIRIFDSTGCFADRIAMLAHRDCICPAPPFVVPESQSICDSDTLRTIRGFVEPGVTVDWYDEQGNLLKKGSVFFKPSQAGIYYAEARDTISGCKGLVRVPSYAFVNPHPSFQGVVTRGTCNGTEVLADAKITLLEVKHGKRYDYTKGNTYTGNKTYDTATDLPLDGVVLKNLANPLAAEFYSFRVFDSTGCYTDSVLVFEPRLCECPRPPFVVPESQAICEGDTLRTVKGFVDSGITVDWYDAPIGGNLLKRGDVFFKPSQAGIYYAEARDTLTNCKATVRAPSYAFVNELPSFNLEAIKPSCVQNTAQNDAIIKIKNLKNGAKYDFSLGDKYVGNRTFDDAFEVLNDSILIRNINNPAVAQKYTIRVFGELNCSTDQTIEIAHFDCNCLPINITVSVPSRVCLDDTLPTLTAIVPENTTVDWYDTPSNGTLLMGNSTSFKPTQIGTYYAEGKSLVQLGCVSTQRIPVKVALAIKPSFGLTSRPATCLGDSAKSDAQILIENISEGERFDYSMGSTYTGNKNYENAKPIPQDGLIINNLSNITQIYTIRVYNRCGFFEDKTIQLIKNECQCSPGPNFPLQVRMKKK